MTIVTPTDDWSGTLSLAADTIFQCRAGDVLLDIGAGAAAGSIDGLLLSCDPKRPLYDSVTLPTGTDVRYRRLVPGRPTTLYYSAL